MLSIVRDVSDVTPPETSTSNDAAYNAPVPARIFIVYVPSCVHVPPVEILVAKLPLPSLEI